MAEREPVPPEVRDRSIGELVSEASEKGALLVREEIALAKAEVQAKVKSLGKGAAVGGAAAVFLIAAGLLLLHGIALLINDLLGVTTAIWLGYLIEAGAFLVLAAIAGLIVKRLFDKGTPPTPEMAIAEAEAALAELRRAGAVDDPQLTRPTSTKATAK
ncbi:MAG: phage holin family protein [Solirubrobacterales bacterium]